MDLHGESTVASCGCDQSGPSQATCWSTTQRRFIKLPSLISLLLWLMSLPLTRCPRLCWRKPPHRTSIARGLHCEMHPEAGHIVPSIQQAICVRAPNPADLYLPCRVQAHSSEASSDMILT